MTAASATAVCGMSTSSISPGEMFSAAPHDHVVEPAVDVEEAVLVEPAGVAGAEPAVVGAGRCCPRTRRRPARRAPRSRPSRRRAGPPRRCRAPPPRGTGGDGPTDPSRARIAGSSLAKASRCSSGVEHGDGRAGLGQAVGVDEVDVGQVGQGALDQLERHAPAAVGEVAQRREARRRASSTASRIRPSMVGTTMAWVMRSSAASSHPSAGVEGGQVHDATPRVERAQHRCDAGDVVRGHADQLRLGRLAAEELDARDDVRDEVAVAQDRRLRLRRRAAGEEQHGDLLGVDEGVLAGHGLGDGGGEVVLGDDVGGAAGAEAGRPRPSSAIMTPPATRPRMPVSCSSGAR